MPKTTRLAAADRKELRALQAKLKKLGYRDVPEHKGIRAGDRVYHDTERYPEAFHTGTADVLAVMVRGTEHPVTEFVVLRDKPIFSFMSRVSSWPSYATRAQGE